MDCASGEGGPGVPVGEELDASKVEVRAGEAGDGGPVDEGVERCRADLVALGEGEAECGGGPYPTDWNWGLRGLAYKVMEMSFMRAKEESSMKRSWSL